MNYGLKQNPTCVPQETRVGSLGVKVEDRAETKRIHAPHKGWRNGVSFTLAHFSLCGMTDVNTSPEPDVVSCLLCLKKLERDARKKQGMI